MGVVLSLVVSLCRIETWPYSCAAKSNPIDFILNLLEISLNHISYEIIITQFGVELNMVKWPDKG